jgi:rod shape determining protein RodA
MVEIVPKFFKASDETPFRRWLGRLDWSLVAAALGLSLMGIMFVYSAMASSGEGAGFVGRQGTALLFGMAGMTFLAVLPYQVLQTYVKPIFVSGILILVAVLIVGTRLRGSRSWFNLGILYFQPVELTRLSLAVALSAFAAARFRDMGEWKTLALPLVLTGLHLGMILLQPDLSSALSLGPMALAVLFAAGAPTGALLALVGFVAIALGIPLAATYVHIVPSARGPEGTVSFFRRAFMERAAFLQLWTGVVVLVGVGWWFLRRMRMSVTVPMLMVSLGVVVGGVAGSFAVERALKDYQRKRLIAFLDQAVDPLGAGYNIRQSEISLGSGRFTGKGYLSGSQSQLGFLPEKHTDFIFSLIGEELGFVGTFLVLAGFFWIVFRAFDIAASARDRFGRYLAIAIGTHLAFTGAVNIGMVMGLMPVTGLPLPFLSYGGSGLVGAWLSVGILLSIHLRRYIL